MKIHRFENRYPPSPDWKERKVSVGLVQFAMSEDREENLRKAIEGIDAAASAGAQIVCLPELFRTPYFPAAEQVATDYSEKIEGDLLSRLSEAALKNKIVLVAGSVYEKSPEGRLFNTAIVFDADGKQLGTYRKIHIPHDPSFYEKNYFESGDLGYRVFQTAYGKVAVLICYDQWFPEAARSAALQGAEIIFYPTAIATVEGIQRQDGNWQESWEAVQRGHAIANHVVVAAVNRVGKENDSSFWGGSFVYDGFGNLLGRMDDQEGVMVGTVDFGHSEHAREGWRFMYSRQPRSYKKLCEI